MAGWRGRPPRGGTARTLGLHVVQITDCLWAPKKIPRPIVEKLNAEVRKALSDPEVSKTIMASLGEPATMPLADIDPFVKAEIAKWAEVVKKAGIKIE